MKHLGNIFLVGGLSVSIGACSLNKNVQKDEKSPNKNNYEIEVYREPYNCIDIREMMKKGKIIFGCKDTIKY